MTSPRRTEQLIRHLARLPMGPADAFERALATGLAAAIGLGLWALDGLGAVRPDAGLGAPVIAVAIRFGGGLALFVIALIWLRDAARPESGASLPLALVAALAVAVLAVALRLTAAERVQMLRPLVDCLLPILALGALPLGAALAALRRGAPGRPARAGALAGLAAGAAGGLIWATACPMTDPAMIVVTYGAAALMLAGIGAALGRVLLVW